MFCHRNHSNFHDFPTIEYIGSVFWVQAPQAEMCEVKVAPCGSLVIELAHSGDDPVPRVLVNGYPLSPADSSQRLRRRGIDNIIGWSSRIFEE